MPITHSLELLKDLTRTIVDLEHRNIFALLADLKELAEDSHGVLPELQHLSEEEVAKLTAAAYVFVKEIINTFSHV